MPPYYVSCCLPNVQKASSLLVGIPQLTYPTILMTISQNKARQVAKEVLRSTVDDGGYLAYPPLPRWPPFSATAVLKTIYAPDTQKYPPIESPGVVILQSFIKISDGIVAISLSVTFLPPKWHGNWQCLIVGASDIAFSSLPPEAWGVTNYYSELFTRSNGMADPLLGSRCSLDTVIQTKNPSKPKKQTPGSPGIFSSTYSSSGNCCKPSKTRNSVNY